MLFWALGIDTKRTMNGHYCLLATEAGYGTDDGRVFNPAEARAVPTAYQSLVFSTALEFFDEGAQTDRFLDYIDR